METNAKKKRFFSMVSRNCNFRDEQNIRDVYYGMVKTIVQECKKDGKILLPGLGEIELKVRPRKTIMNVNTGEMGASQEYKVFKFTACNTLKKYINIK